MTRKKGILRKWGYGLGVLVFGGYLATSTILHKKPGMEKEVLKDRKVKVEEILKGKKVEVVDLYNNKDKSFIDKIIDPEFKIIVYNQNGEAEAISPKGNPYNLEGMIAERGDGEIKLVTRANKDIKPEEIPNLSYLEGRLIIIEKYVEKKYGKTLIDLVKENKNKAYVFEVGTEKVMIYGGDFCPVVEKTP